MAERRTFGQGLDIQHNDILNQLMYGVATAANAATYLGTIKRKIVYHAESGGRLMYRGESANHTLAVLSDVKETFVALNDTPANYTGAAGNYMRVNSTPNGLEFRTTAQVWSDIQPTMGVLTATGSISLDNSTRQLIGGAAQISHLTTAGHKHIPTGGSAGNWLKYSASGTATWTNITWSDIGSIPNDIVYLNAVQTLTNKTFSADLNTLIGKSGDDSGGDLLVYNTLGAKYQRKAKGSTGQVLMSENFDIAWTSLTSSHISNFSATVLGTVLTGFTAGASTTILATDTVLEAFGKTQGQVNNLYDLVTLGIHNRPACKVAFDNPAAQLTTTTNTIDNVTTISGMRVVVFDSSSATQINKIYQASGTTGNWTWTVQQDGTGADLPQEGHTVWVGEGQTYEDTKWTFNSTAWVQIGGTGFYTAGTGIAISTGNVISLATITARSILARATNSSGVPAQLQCGADGRVLMQTSSALVFAEITNANISATAAIAWSKMANLPTSTVVVVGIDGKVTTQENLEVSRGGTGLGTVTNGALLLGNGTNPLVVLAIGSANHFLKSHGTGNSYSSYAMPATITEGDIGKFLRATSTGAIGLEAISFTELPARTLATYPVRLSSAANTVTVTAATHGFDEIVDVMIWRAESGTYRKYEVDYQVNASSKSVVCDSSENWPSGSYLVITGFKGTVVGD